MKNWREVLQLQSPSVSKNQVESRFRILAKSAHPDAGGSTEAMTELNLAKREALMEISRPPAPVVQHPLGQFQNNASQQQAMNAGMGQQQGWYGQGLGNMYGSSAGASGYQSVRNEAVYVDVAREESNDRKDARTVRTSSAWQKFWNAIT